MPRLVAISGLPAGGKSTLGVELAARLGWPFFDKDAFLEALFDAEGVACLDGRNALSRRADAAFEQAARREPVVVVASWWRHPRSASASGTPAWWLLDPGSDVVEAHCACPPDEAARRFHMRSRHVGHLDGRRTFPELLAWFGEQAALGPLRPDAIVCDTSTPLGEQQITSLAERIAVRLGDSKP